MTRPYIFLLVLAAALGVSLGGAFVGGVALGKGQGGGTANLQSTAALRPGGSPAAGFAGAGQPGGFQQRSAGAGLSSGDSGGVGPRFQGQGGARGGGEGLAGRGGLMGTVESIEGNMVTVNTPQGPVQVTLGDDTTITQIVEGTVEDLQVGVQVRIMGQGMDGQSMAATSVIIIPEGSDGLFGQGLSGTEGPQRGRLGQ